MSNREYPHDLERKLNDHYDSIHANLQAAYQGNISQKAANAYFQAAEHEAEALLYSVKAEAARNAWSFDD